MGGRGASSGYYKLHGRGNAYGDEYESVMHPLGNIKIVASRYGGSKSAPRESMTPGRVYATIDRKTGELHSLSYIGSDGRRYKQVDVEDHKGMGPNAHGGYNHDGPARRLSPKERRTLALTRRYIRSKGGIG
jgi:hypothetical protein